MDTASRDGSTIRESCSRFSTVVWLFINSRGAEVRLKIIEKLRERPMNINQLAMELGVDYKTVKYHLMVLGKYGFVSRISNNYGSPYYLSDEVFKHWDELIQIINSYKSYKG
ncbi:ArsR/SmtB family transcription factor [Caldivirga maquilingensis]|uniref:Regulatory protein ArsR n=1 Tax=Caldivirga maquilingensis (strain ATCC 700844 / DSM 13496 / JCM 10307 / IC-167) TaxID=397948 RepID=A8M8X6_CALMQ|nr:winged helix-turn-helix domain-containing protein [Caldivirga maquilingensis]ABW02195.1 regulatory protein ArsR [Caldivirga maquilingensis IC-167]